MKKYNLLIATAASCIGTVVWKLTGITGNELLFTFICIWSLPSTLGFSAGLTLYRNKLNIIPPVIGIALTVALPLWCFGTYHLIPSALAVFFTVCGMCVSSVFRKMFGR